MHTSAAESVALPVEVGAERRGGTEMAFILGFVAATIAKMLDPLSLAVAAAFGLFVGTRANKETRWAIIILGVVAILAMSAALAAAAAHLDGTTMRLRWPETAAAGFLQVWLISMAAHKWHTNSRIRRRLKSRPLIDLLHRSEMAALALIGARQPASVGSAAVLTKEGEMNEADQDLWAANPGEGSMGTTSLLPVFLGMAS